MRRATILTISLLFLSLNSLVAVELASANPDPHMWRGPLKNAVPPSITLYSPENKTYSSNNLTLYLTSEISKLPQVSVWGKVGITEIYLEADWITNYTIINPDNTYEKVMSHIPLYPVNVTYALADIPDGNHSLRITAIESGEAGWNDENDLAAVYTINVNSSVTVNFAIDTTPPKITILSIGNQTYSTIDIPLRFDVNETASRIYYSLDNNANVTVNGNTTLSNLSYGSHSLAIYANDTYGNISSQTVAFTVAKSEPFQPMSVVFASALAIVVIAISLILFRRHRKTKSKKETV